MSGLSLLRTLGSRLLACGCLVGVYEKYSGEVVEILDARAPSCTVATHQPGEILPTANPPAAGPPER